MLKRVALILLMQLAACQVALNQERSLNGQVIVYEHEEEDKTDMIVGITIPVSLIFLTPCICCALLMLCGICILINVCLYSLDACWCLGLTGFGVYRFKTRHDRPKKKIKKPSTSPIQVVTKRRTDRV